MFQQIATALQDSQSSRWARSDWEWLITTLLVVLTLAITFLGWRSSKRQEKRQSRVDTPRPTFSYGGRSSQELSAFASNPGGNASKVLMLAQYQKRIYLYDDTMPAQVYLPQAYPLASMCVVDQEVHDPETLLTLARDSHNRWWYYPAGEPQQVLNNNPEYLINELSLPISYKDGKIIRANAEDK